VRKVLGVLLVLLASQVLSAQQPLAITRVLLFKNGMAYLVRTGQLAAPVSLTFHPEDMNDVLKSFTAWNPDTNELYSVGYTAGIPSTHLLSRFPFDITSPETGLGGFLRQVKGADVRLDHGRTLEGKLVAVQETNRTTAPQTSAPDSRLTVLRRDGSLQTVWLSDVRSVELADPQLREQLRSYLEVLAAGRQDVTREISVYPGATPGPIQVAYLQQFPLWKTSYRVDLSASQSRIQGWAQIDNPTGEAWENVTVSLVSGAPVSFVMNLYDPLYTARATVPVPGGQVAAPRQYEHAVSETVTVVGESPAVDLQNARQLGAAGGRGTVLDRAGGALAAPRAPASITAAGGFQQADAARIEDFYEYTFPFSVRINSRQSALLPFLQKTLNVEKLSIFNASADRGNPRLGARLENTTDIPFEAGPITFFHDSRYSGEAVLDYLPRGERALVSFGVDYDIQVASKRQSRPENTVRLMISNGVAVVFNESLQTTTYEIRNKGLETKTLIVEHPRTDNRRLAGIEPFETTDNFHRFRVALDPQQATTLVATEVVSRQASVSLQKLTRPQLTWFDNKATPQRIRERLGEIVGIQEQVASMRGEMQALQGGIDTLFSDQARLRENLKALGDGAEDQQVRSRYLQQLRTQEDRIDDARARIATLTADVASSETRLSDLISNLVFE
jgi:hypothetical protein